MGADYLEQDIVATEDDELVVLHDIHLDRVTNVAELFPGRHRRDGRFYAKDFSLSDIRRLSVHERTAADGRPVYPGRFQSGSEVFRVHTFAEELAFIHELQENLGRPVGIYPEIKRPAWHREEGVEITPLFLQVLSDFGYESHDDPVYVQCFDAQELKRIRKDHNSRLKLIQLIGENDWQESATNYDELRTARGLRRLARTVDGIGPWVNRLYRIGANAAVRDSGLVARAHDAGLAVHPYTFRKDELPPGFSTFEDLINFMIDELNIDGLFTDFPDLVVKKCNAH
jgi:glycerophosphoryl diester phosphodiesterase